ncbi:hypothetical protein KBZ15_13595 [Cyanobium sp. BA20m-p-22]|nr:hypothetical protein [Cyanobium sp. BA20m-p-22]
MAEDALAGKDFSAEADDEAEHGQATIPGFSEGNETETGGGIRHDFSLVTKLEETVTDLEARVAQRSISLCRQRPWD